MLSAFFRYLLCAVLAVLLITVDLRLQLLAGARQAAAAVLEPLYAVTAAPVALGRWFAGVFVDKRELEERYDTLRHEYLKLRADTMRFRSVEAENERLRRLLKIPGSGGGGFQVAELLEINLKPFARKAVLGKGRLDGVHAGQLVVDAHGVYGQVSRVGLRTSTALLLTSASHAIPVQVKRNGLRAVAYGLGASRALRVSHLAPLDDIVTGDVLVTSGMGHRFPPGYPVARVTEVVREAGDGSIHVRAAPLARFGYNKEVLLVRSWRQDDEYPDAAEPVRPAAESAAESAADPGERR